MARRDDIEAFAAEHDLKIGTIEDLIAARLVRGRTVSRVRTEQVNTAHGEFTMHVYEDSVNHATHLALVCGEVGTDASTLVRVHVENTLGDTIGVAGGSSWPLPDALRRITADKRGVAVVLRLPEKYAGLQAQLGEALQTGDEERPRKPLDRWTLGVGGQILNDLGVKRMRLMSSPQRFHGLGGFGLSVEEYIHE